MKRDEILPLLIVVPAVVGLYAFTAHVVHLLSWRQRLIGIAVLAGGVGWTWIGVRTAGRRVPGRSPWPASEWDAFRAARSLSQQHLRDQLRRHPLGRRFWLFLLVSTLLFAVALWVVP